MYNNSLQGRVDEPKAAPYMQNITSQLDSQLKRLEEYIGRVHNMADRLAVVQGKPEKDSAGQEQLPGYLATLNSRVDIMRVMNDRLEYLVQHLEQCI